jgi:hypothetical protein
LCQAKAFTRDAIENLPSLSFLAANDLFHLCCRHVALAFLQQNTNILDRTIKSPQASAHALY